MNLDKPHGTKKLYFAYGSNMSMEQMQKRCPGSTFVGRGVLHHYCWQINERGYANILGAGTLTKESPMDDETVPDVTIFSPNSCVHGLVYELDESGDDEAILDSHEGVGFGAYEKFHVDIDYYRFAESVSPPEIFKAVDVRDMATRKLGGFEEPARVAENVLVYRSLRFMIPGKPQPEYFQRMNMAMSDAYAMGVPEDYLAQDLMPLMVDHVPEKVALCMELIKDRIDGSDNDSVSEPGEV